MILVKLKLNTSMPPNDNRNKNNPNDPAQVSPIDPETIKVWIQNQTIELQNQKSENEIRKIEIEANTRLSEKSLDIQKEVLTNRGRDFRMTITRLAWIGASFLIILLLFFGFCLWFNKDQFAYKVGQGISYLFTTFLGYFFGRKSINKTEQNSAFNEEQVF